MRIEAARAAGEDWVRGHAAEREGFVGAYFSGSTVGMPDTAELPVGSDVDIMLVLDADEPPPKLGKFIHQGVLLEVSHQAAQRFGSAEAVLSNYHLAAGLRRNTIIADPTGRLSTVQSVVAKDFAKRHWVERRCEAAFAGIENHLSGIDPAAPWPGQVMSWLFGTGVTCHPLLVAALRNPTVRLRYLAARRVLDDYGHAEPYPRLLSLLGCRDWTPTQTEAHLAALSETFDAASRAARGSFPFGSDITAAARPIAIDGCAELIRAGDHREAVFWILATFARCHLILHADAPSESAAHRPAFDAALADLGIADTADLVDRAALVRRYLPELAAHCQAIMAENSEIVD